MINHHCFGTDRYIVVEIFAEPTQMLERVWVIVDILRNGNAVQNVRCIFHALLQTFTGKNFVLVVADNYETNPRGR